MKTSVNCFARLSNIYLHCCLNIQYTVIKSNLSLYSIRCITLQCVTSWRGSSPRHCPQPTQLLLKKCSSVAIRWQHCVRFNHRWSRGHNVRGQLLKKIRGQGPTFRVHTFSRPRTEMVEAKDRGHYFSKLWWVKFSYYTIFIIYCY